MPAAEGYAGAAIKGDRLYVNDYNVQRGEHWVRCVLTDAEGLEETAGNERGVILHALRGTAGFKRDFVVLPYALEPPAGTRAPAGRV